MKTILVNEPTSTMSPNPKRKSLLARMGETVDEQGKKFEQSAQKVIDAANNAVDGAKRVAIAGTNALVDASEGKELEEIVKNVSDIYQAGSADKAALKMVDVRLGGLTREAVRVSEVSTAEHTVYPLMHMNKVIAVSIPPAREDSRARKYVRFAAHAYGSYSTKILPAGYLPIESRKTKEGLKASLYGNAEEIVCAFAGSETVADWKNNFTQLAGASEQYEDALAYAKELRKRFPSKKLVFVGHSQGGGEAAYCAYNIGMQAETYNPAGLSIFTKYNSHSNVSAEAKINAYVFSTDILNFFQTTLGVGLGAIKADGDIHYILDANILEHGMHGMKGILKYFEIDL